MYSLLQPLVDIADYITNVEMIKHPFKSGIDARKGIEY
ncbi:MAG: cob(I)yrinic acid a,c-diamide adenosyltransferase [Promethearchaeota archaeon]